jgi:acetylornithine deacetylase/succinyl-diaminopimelate desuccinylase-like protein
LEQVLEQIGEEVFGAPCYRLGIGGGIPFMALLSRLYPGAQFVATGALGSDSNLHVPDEWLNVAFAERVTQAIAHILDAHARNSREG